MAAVVLLGLFAFILCLVATPLVRDFSLRAQLVDRPDLHRKRHLRSTPRLGGVAIILSYLGALGAILILPHGGALFVQHRPLLLSLLPAAGLVFITGLADDLFTLRPWQKLAGQSIAAIVAVSLGARISLHHGPPWLIPLASFMLLIVYTNAMNLIDGLDGLATGVALFATLSSLCVAVLSRDIGLTVATVPLAACLLAFLRYNFHPASIFLGDCGSLTVGFMLGCFALTWSRHTGTLLGIAAPLLALALPLLDVTLAIARRHLRGAHIFNGDRHHIHHKVLLRCLTTKKAVFALYAVSGLASTLALAMSISEHRTRWAIGIGAVVLAFCGVISLEYVELTAAIQTLSYTSLSIRIKEAIFLMELKQELEKAETIEAVWQIACSALRHLRIASFEMIIHDSHQHLEIEMRPALQAWRMSMSLGSKADIHLTRDRDAGEVRQMMAVLDCLRSSVESKSFIREPRPTPHPAFSHQGAA